MHKLLYTVWLKFWAQKGRCQLPMHKHRKCDNHMQTQNFNIHITKRFLLIFKTTEHSHPFPQHTTVEYVL